MNLGPAGNTPSKPLNKGLKISSSNQTLATVLTQKHTLTHHTDLNHTDNRKCYINDELSSLYSERFFTFHYRIEEHLFALLTALTYI